MSVSLSNQNMNSTNEHLYNSPAVTMHATDEK